jgi:hypothetical protein
MEINRELFRYAGFCVLRYAMSECCEVAAMVLCSVLVLCSQLAKEVTRQTVDVAYV